MKLAIKLSIIIPIGPGDDSWRSLLRELEPLLSKAEIIFTSSEAISLPKEWNEDSLVKRITAPLGRAKQMNAGVTQATGEVFWFLHSDSKFSASTLVAVDKLLQKSIKGIYFFDLSFFEGPLLMNLNRIGVWIRSRLLKLPFGDQGFIMTRQVFQHLGGFSETALYGEDHLLIWRAHQLRIPVKPIQALLLTSGRKYSDNGWLSTTQRHLRLTYQQGKVEWQRIQKEKKE
ncbi:MAG: glycosyl transferase family 2 [Bdellovibrionales bacterium]|nr:glycosyl transferase family 2 [Bdellovibrionales bacterium]